MIGLESIMGSLTFPSKGAPRKTLMGALTNAVKSKAPTAPTKGTGLSGWYSPSIRLKGPNPTSGNGLFSWSSPLSGLTKTGNTGFSGWYNPLSRRKGPTQTGGKHLFGQAPTGSTGLNGVISQQVTGRRYFHTRPPRTNPSGVKVQPPTPVLPKVTKPDEFTSAVKPGINTMVKPGFNTITGAEVMGSDAKTFSGSNVGMGNMKPLPAYRLGGLATQRPGRTINKKKQTDTLGLGKSALGIGIGI